MLLLHCLKRVAGVVTGIRGRYHADPLLTQYGMLKVGDLYRQQLRVYAWRFCNGQLPENHAAMLSRVSDVHRYGTRLAGSLLHISTGDCRAVNYRVPKDWASLSEAQRGMGSLAGSKGGSRRGFLDAYGSFVCRDRGSGVYVGAALVGQRFSIDLELEEKICVVPFTSYTNGSKL